MLIVSWLISLILVGFLGYHWRELNERLKTVEAFVKLKVIEKKKVEESSTFIDPEDIVQRAKFEHSELLKKLNPDDN